MTRVTDRGVGLDGGGHTMCAAWIGTRCSLAAANPRVSCLRAVRRLLRRFWRRSVGGVESRGTLVVDVCQPSRNPCAHPKHTHSRPILLATADGGSQKVRLAPKASLSDTRARVPKACRWLPDAAEAHSRRRRARRAVATRWSGRGRGRVVGEAIETCDVPLASQARRSWCSTAEDGGSQGDDG